MTDSLPKLEWQDLKYYLTSKGQNQKYILDGISGTAHPRRLLAVLGESGSGKTTFLNAVNSRLRVDATHKLEGEISINGAPCNASSDVAFVTQDDILFDTTTPAEALYFSARVRAGLSKDKATQRTNEVLQELMLTDVKDTFLGTPGLTRGVSGGERKRTNIAVELITDPKVLLLDEPTSGLDSFTAFRCVQTLQMLARKGRTVVCTIHQPSADIFELFDDLMLIVSGQVIYHGAAQKSLEYFESIGYQCPSNFTPTDYFMALMQDEAVKPALFDEWKKCVQSKKSLTYQHAPEKTVSFQSNEPRTKISRCCGSAWIQFSELCLRSWRNHYRNRYLLTAQLGQSVVFGLFVGLVFINLGVDQTSVQDRMGLFFLLATNAAFAGAGNVVNTFATEKTVFLREQQSCAYSPAWYFLGKNIGELPFGVLNPVLLNIIVYFTAGLTRSFGTFMLILITMILGYQGGVSFGLFLGAVSPNFMVSNALLPMVLVPLCLAGGIAVSSSRISSKYWIWMEKISSIRYTFMSLAKLEFSKIPEITCDNVKYQGRCASMFHTGKDVLQYFGYDNAQLWALFLSLIGAILVLRVFALMALYRISREKI